MNCQSLFLGDVQKVSEGGEQHFRSTSFCIRSEKERGGGVETRFGIVLYGSSSEWG